MMVRPSEVARPAAFMPPVKDDVASPVMVRKPADWLVVEALVDQRLVAKKLVVVASSATRFVV